MGSQNEVRAPTSPSAVSDSPKPPGNRTPNQQAEVRLKAKTKEKGQK